MKRTITDLEQKLIGKGLKLSHKNYVGKHSQYVSGYVYKGELEVCIDDNFPMFVKVEVNINPKRDCIDFVAFENPFNSKNLHHSLLKTLCDIDEQINKIIYE